MALRALAAAFVAALSVTPATAVASGIVTADFRNPTLQVNAKGIALVQYVDGSGTAKHVLLWGAVNGVVITRMKLPPFIVTLGTYSMTFGFGDLLSGGTYLGAPVPTSFTSNFGNAKFLGIYLPLWLAVVVLLVAHVFFQYARFGRYTRAVGSNNEGSRRTGIGVDLHIVKVYTLAGLLAGLAGVLDLAIFTNTTSVSHLTDNLNAISAVVLGGTSLFGGVGSILMSAVGAFIPTVLQNGLVIMSVQPFWQEVAVGATIILAVYLDQLRRRRSAGGR